MIISAASDYRAAAQRILPPFLFHYIDGGAYAEHTLRRNVEDLSDVALRQRILRNMSDLSLETTLFNEKLAMPTALAPVGLCGMYARRRGGRQRHSVHPLYRFRLPDRRGRPDHQAPDVVPAVCPARPRLYAQCAGARQSRRLLDAGLYRRYADSRRPLPRRPFRHERPERRPAPLLAGRHPSAVGVGRRP